MFNNNIFSRVFGMRAGNANQVNVKEEVMTTNKVFVDFAGLLRSKGKELGVFDLVTYDTLSDMVKLGVHGIPMTFELIGGDEITPSTIGCMKDHITDVLQSLVDEYNNGVDIDTLIENLLATLSHVQEVKPLQEEIFDIGQGYVVKVLPNKDRDVYRVHFYVKDQMIGGELWNLNNTDNVIEELKKSVLERREELEAQTKSLLPKLDKVNQEDLAYVKELGVLLRKAWSNMRDGVKIRLANKLPRCGEIKDVSFKIDLRRTDEKLETHIAIVFNSDLGAAGVILSKTSKSGDISVYSNTLELTKEEKREIACMYEFLSNMLMSNVVSDL